MLQQLKIKSYRVDFAIVPAMIVVEVDGHDYHSTKEQRARDARRDRELIRAGWRVMRFTGSEVYADADGCVEEVLLLLQPT